MTIQISKLSVALDVQVADYINDLKKAQVATDKRLNDITNSYKKTGAAAGETTKGFKLANNSTQQLGYQLQDVAVQAQMGTSAFVILGQQGSQLASVLGPQGALIGAAIALGSAIGGVLYTVIMGGSKAIKEYKADLDKLAGSIKSISKLSSAQKKVELGLSEEQLKSNQKQIDALAGKIARYSKQLDTGEKQVARFTKTGTLFLETVKLTKKQIVALSKDLIAEQANLDNVTQSTKKILEVKQELANGTHKLTEANKKAAKKVIEQIKALEIEREVTGKTAREVAILTANRNKALPAQIAQINSIYDSIEAYEAQEEAIKSTAKTQAAATSLANQLISKGATQTLTAREKVTADLNKLNAAWRSGDLQSEELYQQALQSIHDRYAKIDADGVIAKKREADKARAAELSAIAKSEAIKRQLATDTYNFERTQALTKYASIAVDTEREYELAAQKYEDQQKQYVGNKEMLDHIDKQYTEKKLAIEANEQQQKELAASSDLDTLAEAFGIKLNMQENYAKTTAAINSVLAAVQVWGDPAMSFYEKVPASLAAAAAVADLAGQFHGGTDAVPAHMDNKSFMLKAGERVVQPEANKKLTKFLDGNNIQTYGGGGGGNITQNLSFGSALIGKNEFDAALVRSQSSLGVLVKNQERKRPTKSNRSRS